MASIVFWVRLSDRGQRITWQLVRGREPPGKTLDRCQRFLNRPGRLAGCRQDDFLERHVRIFGAGHQLVQIVHIGFMVFTIVEADGICGNAPISMVSNTG